MIAAIKNVLSPISEAKIIDAERRNPSSTMIDCRFIVIVFLLNVVVIRSIEQSSQMSKSGEFVLSNSNLFSPNPYSTRLTRERDKEREHARARERER